LDLTGGYRGAAGGRLGEVDQPGGGGRGSLLALLLAGRPPPSARRLNPHLHGQGADRAQALRR
jgi:hypothetical protein